MTEERDGVVGIARLRDPLLNKGTAFTEAERDRYHLRGLLPPRPITLELQARRVMDNLRALEKPINRYVALEALHDRNETLYYRVVMDYIEETMPIIYTPTVGLACQEFDIRFRRPRGLYISSADRGRVAQLIANWHQPEVDIIVVTDGERILGLGDLGANGMGIPIGKLALYTACAGVHPARTLPVQIDVGTNNETLRNDPLYLGLLQPRLRGPEYDALIEEFITAARARWPHVLVQFEDFANHHAFELLERWRHRVPSFNDDIQGTAAVAVAGLFSALRATGGQLAQQRLLFLGAGEAATGIADLTVSALVSEGMDAAQAHTHCWLFDSQGLVTAGRATLTEHKRAYAHEHPPIADFATAIETLKPTGIVGVAAAPGAFDEKVLSALARINQQPLVFALSNPTSKCECTPAEAYRHTGGRALYASGSPFAPVDFEGQRRVPRQGNNSYVFPGIGLGAIVAQAREVTNEMFLVAARTLAEQVSEADLAQGSLYPPLAKVREVSAYIAAAVAGVAYERGIAAAPRPADLLAEVQRRMYEPVYD